MYSSQRSEVEVVRKSDAIAIDVAEDSAKQHANDLAPYVDQLVKRVMVLYQGTSMPMSDARCGCCRQQPA